jgi:hypothetical protein
MKWPEPFWEWQNYGSTANIIGHFSAPFRFGLPKPPKISDTSGLEDADGWAVARARFLIPKPYSQQPF